MYCLGFHYIKSRCICQLFLTYFDGFWIYRECLLVSAAWWRRMQRLFHRYLFGAVPVQPVPDTSNTGDITGVSAVWLCIMPLYSLRSWRDGTANGYFCTNISLPCPCSDFQQGYKKRCRCCRQCIKLIQRHRVSFQMLPLLCKCLIWNQCFLLPSFMSVALWGIKNTVFVSRKTTVYFNTIFNTRKYRFYFVFDTIQTMFKLILSI